MKEPKSTFDAADAWNAPGWKEAVAEYHQQRGGQALVVEIAPERLKKLRRLMDDDISLERAWNELNRQDGVAASTLMAAEFLVHQGDAERFRNWLSQHSAEEHEAIRKYLEAKRCRSRQSK